MDTALPQKFPFILDRNLAKANCTENPVCTSCDKVVLDPGIYPFNPLGWVFYHKKNFFFFFFFLKWVFMMKLNYFL